MEINRREAIKRMAYTSLLLSLGSIGNLYADDSIRINPKYFKYSLNRSFPRFDYFSVDSLGKSKLDNSPLILENIMETLFNSRTENNVTKYFVQGNYKTAAWEFIPTKKGFVLKSNYVTGNIPWEIKFNQHKNHTTVLGLLHEKNKIKTPCVIHLPGMGSLKVRSKQVDVLDYTSARINVPTNFVQIAFPPASKIKKSIEYSFEIDAIHPDLEKIVGDPRFDGYRRSYINTFQVNPNIKMLANNSSSDSCGFVQYGYSEVALQTPNLVDNLKAIDLVGITIDTYLSGIKGYGMKGYKSDALGDTENTNWGNQSSSLDTYPSLLMAGCNYYLGSGNKRWLKKNYKGLVSWANEIIERDCDDDGIIEYGFSGNSGSWSGDHLMRPANWWDTIGFGHKDAYSNAIAYRAMKKFAKISKEFGEVKKAKQYNDFAEKLKSNYYDTFINPETGVLAGWKSEDGELHDYYFTFVNGIAIAYNLVSIEQGNKIMNSILAKIDEVGFDNFELGLPGNLIPVKHDDYTHHDPRWGGSTSDELNDGWQKYENGGTSGNYVYFTIKALFRLGRFEDAEKILFPLLKGIEDGNFQGECDNGMTKDWRTWDGECWGYEGFLVDNYWSLLAVTEQYK